jgi:hypothetical protein
VEDEDGLVSPLLQVVPHRFSGGRKGGREGESHPFINSLKTASL